MADHPKRNRAYIAILAFASATILIVGTMLKPEPRAEAPAAPPPSETDLVRLTRLSQRRALENTSAYFASVADEASRSLVHVPDIQATALAWTDRLLVAPRSARERRGPQGAGGNEGSPPLRASDWHPRLPLMSLGMPADRALVPPSRAEATPAAGDWLIAVWQTGTGRTFAPGTFLGIDTATCGQLQVQEILTSITPLSTMAGAVVVNAGGGLVGVVLPCNGRLAAVSPGDVARMLELAQSLEGRIAATWGFRADRITLDEAAFFKLFGGVIVREIWAGLPADRAGLRAGDVLVAIDEKPVENLESLESLMTSETPVLTVRRASATVAIPMNVGEARAPEETPDTAVPLGFVWEAPAGYRIDSIVPGSAAANAGIQPGDVLLRISSVEPRNMAEVRRLLARGRASAAFVELQRGDRRWGVLLR